jgi:hypothetical protein
MNIALIGIVALLIIPLIIGGAYVVRNRGTDPGAPTRTAAAGGSWGTKKVADRRALWARRYGAGAAWTAGTIGITSMSGIEGVGDPHATGGGAGAVGGGVGCGGGACGGGVGCSAGGCSGGGGGCGVGGG